jgi:hypothetical protein
MSLYKPVQLGAASYTEAKHWLSLHMNDVRRFIHSRNQYATIEDFIRATNGNITLAYETVYDFVTPNSHKEQWLINWLTHGSKITMLTGKRGGGKTATAYKFMEYYYDAGTQPCILGPPQKHPPEIDRVSRLQDVPVDNVVFVDEIGVRYNARKSSDKEKVADLSILPVLRHSGRSVITATQLSALGDVNFSRLTDMIVAKPMGLFGNSLERDVLRKAIPDIFMPQSREVSHCLCNDFRCNVELGLSRFWKPEYSTPYTILQPDEVVDYLRELLGDEMQEQDILSEIKLRSTNMKDSEIKDLIQQIQES